MSASRHAVAAWSEQCERLDAIARGCAALESMPPEFAGPLLALAGAGQHEPASTVATLRAVGPVLAAIASQSQTLAGLLAVQAPEHAELATLAREAERSRLALAVALAADPEAKSEATRRAAAAATLRTRAAEHARTGA